MRVVLGGVESCGINLSKKVEVASYADAAGGAWAFSAATVSLQQEPLRKHLLCVVLKISFNKAIYEMLSSRSNKPFFRAYYTPMPGNR